MILVTGAGGLLGRSVSERLEGDVRAFTHAQLDVSDADAVREAINDVRPDFVVHCAAITDVDACEVQTERNWAVNAEAPGYVGAAAAEVGAEIVAVSTDYVFDGARGRYTESDRPDPLQEYGRAKLAGEQRAREANPRHYIVRSAWVYGAGGHNFISQFPRLAREPGELKVVADQWSSPTYAPDLADAIGGLRGTGRYGTYHAVNEGGCSYAEFYRYGLELLGSDKPLIELASTNIPRPAARPRNSTLVGEAWAAAGFAPLRPWRDAAKAYIEAAAKLH